MSEHRATISWQRGDAAFDYEGYSRHHTWEFAGGTRVESPAPGDDRPRREAAVPRGSTLA